MRIAHLTDLHFGAADPEIVRVLEQDLRHCAPDVVVVTGDLTQRGSRSEFRDAAQFLERIDAHRVVVPGNHDVPSRSLLARALHPYSRYRTWIDEDIDPRKVVGEIAFAGINSARRSRLGWNWSLGSVSRSQLDRALAFLTAGAGGVRCLALHHPLIAVGARQANRVANRAGGVLERMLGEGVDLVLCGHSHRPLVMELRAGDRDHASTLVVQSSTATSWRQRGQANGYTIIDLQPRRFLVQPRALTEEGRFVTSWERGYERMPRAGTDEAPAPAGRAAAADPAPAPDAGSALAGGGGEAVRRAGGRQP